MVILFGLSEFAGEVYDARLCFSERKQSAGRLLGGSLDRNCLASALYLAGCGGAASFSGYVSYSTATKSEGAMAQDQLLTTVITVQVPRDCTMIPMGTDKGTQDSECP